MQYTTDQEIFLQKYVPSHSRQEICDEFNKRFGTERNINQLAKKYGRMGLTNGIDTKFQKGKQPHENSKATQFKKGLHPMNLAEIGTEVCKIDKRCNKKYYYIKVAHPNVWKQKQNWVYEEEYGEIPQGSIVIFLDGDSTNFNISNLKCITKKEHVIINNRGLRCDDADITLAGVQLAKMYSKLYDSSHGGIKIPLNKKR